MTIIRNVCHHRHVMHVVKVKSMLFPLGQDPHKNPREKKNNIPQNNIPSQTFFFSYQSYLVSTVCQDNHTQRDIPSMLLAGNTLGKITA